MSYQGICFAFAALLALYLFASNDMFGGRTCPICGGAGKHHQSCPQKDRDE